MDSLRREVRYRLESGNVLRSQPVAVLSKFYAPEEWCSLVEQLELLDIRLHDRLGELLGREEWPND
ncbi:DUF4327 family protein [Gloeobacter kilaueensis]|nr:DUF4327 family protein [Gloeobacter kilaueensis]